MAPPRSSTQRQQVDSDQNFNNDLFIDPMLGSPLAIYVEKDVQDKDAIAQLIVVSFRCLLVFTSYNLCLVIWRCIYANIFNRNMGARFPQAIVEFPTSWVCAIIVAQIALCSCRYNIVDPQKSSGQNLWRQYAGKKGKLVLDARWVHECIKAGQLQTIHSNWAGCKVTGSET